MDHQSEQRIFPIPAPGQVVGQGVAKSFMASVFLWMFAALAISALAAYYFASNDALMAKLITNTGLTGLGKVVMFAPLGFVLLMSFGYARLSAPVLSALFFAYAAITGISLSFILLAYTPGSVVTCFVSSAAMFGVMGFLGYTTDKDLTSFGRILTMGLIGLLVAIVINFFMRSSGLDYLISIIGVAVFTGLTAYDVQKLKRIGEGIEFDGAAATDVKKMAVLGALTLYLDFINLFLFMLRLFGRRD